MVFVFRGWYAQGWHWRLLLPHAQLPGRIIPFWPCYRTSLPRLYGYQTEKIQHVCVGDVYVTMSSAVLELVQEQEPLPIDWEKNPAMMLIKNDKYVLINTAKKL